MRIQDRNYSINNCLEQSNKKPQQNPTFGVRFTPKTVKRLKEVTPDILSFAKNDQDYTLVEDAINHLIHAGKRIDGYVVELNDDYIRGFQFFEIRTKNTKGKCKDFLYPPYKYEGQFSNNTAITSFYKKCKFIDSEEFIPQTDEEINKWVNHRNSQSKFKNFKDDMFTIWEDVKEKFEDGWDLLGDLFAVDIDPLTLKKTWHPLGSLERKLYNNIINSSIDEQNIDKINEIRKLIDKMRTKPINIDVRTTIIEEKPKMIESPRKLIEKK